MSLYLKLKPRLPEFNIELVTLDNFLSYIQDEGINATYWAGGPWWGKYKLRITPDRGKDRPQMKIVGKYLYTESDLSEQVFIK